jgi:hypothetical protein
MSKHTPITRPEVYPETLVSNVNDFPVVEFDGTEKMLQRGDTYTVGNNIAEIHLRSGVGSPEGAEGQGDLLAQEAALSLESGEQGIHGRRNAAESVTPLEPQPVLANPASQPYFDQTVTQLKRLAKERGIKDGARKNRSELIEALSSSDNDEESAENSGENQE